MSFFEKMNSGFREPAKHFKTSLLDVQSIVRNDGEQRTYTLPTGEIYPSVTTVLKKLPSDGLDAWVKRVGKIEAERIKLTAARRGTNLHAMVEAYLGGLPNASQGHMPINVSMFRSLKPHLDNIEEIYGIEMPLYSHRLKAAGATDLFAKYSGKNCIIDIKNAINPKTEDFILNYFLQTTAYSVMIEEMYNISVDAIVILVAIESGETQVFMKDPRDYMDQVFELFGKE